MATTVEQMTEILAQELMKHYTHNKNVRFISPIPAYNDATERVQQAVNMALTQAANSVQREVVFDNKGKAC